MGLYVCKFCEYTCNKKDSYNKHLSSKKHQYAVNKNTNSTKNTIKDTINNTQSIITTCEITKRDADTNTVGIDITNTDIETINGLNNITCETTNTDVKISNTQDSKCDICNKTFANKYSLSRHKKSICMDQKKDGGKNNETIELYRELLDTKNTLLKERERFIKFLINPGQIDNIYNKSKNTKNTTNNFN
jgi:hypothetical protein